MDYDHTIWQSERQTGVCHGNKKVLQAEETACAKMWRYKYGGAQEVLQMDGLVVLTLFQALCTYQLLNSYGNRHHMNSILQRSNHYGTNKQQRWSLVNNPCARHEPVCLRRSSCLHCARGERHWIWPYVVWGHILGQHTLGTS